MKGSLEGRRKSGRFPNLKKNHQRNGGMSLSLKRCRLRGGVQSQRHRTGPREWRNGRGSARDGARDEWRGRDLQGWWWLTRADTHARRGGSSATRDMGGSRMLAGSKKAQLFWLRFYVGWILLKNCVVAGAKEKEEQEGPVTDWRASDADLSWQICEKTLDIQRSRRRFRKGWDIQLPKKDLVETRIYQSYRMNNLWSHEPWSTCGRYPWMDDPSRTEKPRRKGPRTSPRLGESFGRKLSLEIAFW